ncbi:MAG: TM1812 family CRISPR-associated protein [Faecalibacterium sp.]
MLKTYLTTVPLQGRFDLDRVAYQREAPAAPTPTRFPILQVIRDTLCPGDTVQVIAIRQENADTARNYQYLLDELAELGIAKAQVRQLCLPEDQRPETLVCLCRDVVDALPQVTRVYTCITYGTKSLPVVMLAALTCAEATHTELEVGGIYYGDLHREGGQVKSAALCNVTVLYQLSGLVGGIRNSRTAEEVFHQLIWMSEHREG